ncbi:MAG: DNA repair protein RecO [Rhodospirillales bacterium]|nr:DNA repair protein RecO [Rhodospirillales bacterium]
MDWTAPAIILEARPYGEADLIVTAMTEDHGAHRGLARGGASRAQAGLWLAGNLAELRWVARLAEQLGSFSGELIHPAAALAMADPLALGILSAATAVAAGALPEREPHPRVFAPLLHLIARLADPEAALPELIRWEAALLAELGYGLDLARCAVTGAIEGLAFVSPRSGRAVTREAAAGLEARLLPLPALLTDPAASAPPAACRDGLALTGHFLARDAFGLHHKPLPQARRMLYDRVTLLAQTESPPDAG